MIHGQLPRLARLFRDRRGTTAVEFGLVGLPFFALLLAIFELAYVDFQNMSLANAVESAARAMLTGRLQAASVTTTQQFVSTYLCPANSHVLGSAFDCSKLIVDVRTASSFTSGDMANDFYKSSTNTFCPGAPGQIVVMRVAYPLGAIFPVNLFNPTVSTVNDVPGLAGRYHILMSEALFQEENYSGTFTPQAGC